MPQEIELKLRVDSHTPITQRLNDLHALHTAHVRETNIFLDRPDNSLRLADRGLRVRLATPHPDSPNPTPPPPLLTVKGPKQSDALQSREAFDLSCTPADQLLPLLAALGFVPLFSFEKDRDSWELDHCKIELDTLPHFGRFLEIEGPSEPAVLALQSKLHLTHLSLIRESYSKMVSTYLKTKPNAPQELRFT